MIETWIAEGYRDTMAKGKTEPLVLSCRPQADPAGESREFVVKAVGCPEVYPESLYNEAFGCLLAREVFQVTAPEPVLVEIPQELLPLIESSLAYGGRGRVPIVGLGVGSEFLARGQAVPPTLSTLKESELQDAAFIYAFDHAVQNPDRKVNNPNCLSDGARFFAIDFELCFSFTHLIFPMGKPWEVTRHKLYPSDPHLFGSTLAGTEVDWSPVANAVASISESRLKRLTSCIPSAWIKNEPKIFGHLLELADHSAAFVDELRRSLS